MPASLEHMPAKLHCNLHLPLNMNKGNNYRNLPQLLSTFHNNNCLRPRQVQCHVERAFNLLGHILTQDRLNMSNETLRHLAIMYVNKMTRRSSNLTTHERIMLCPSLQGVRRCILLCLV